MSHPTHLMVTKSLLLLAAAGAAACLSGCSSSVGGSGSGGASSAVGSDTGSAPAASIPTDASVATSTPVDTATATVTHTSSSSATTSSKPPVVLTSGVTLPDLTSFTASTPTCATKTGSVTITLTWKSKNATEAWIDQPVTATAAGNPKTETPTNGPLKPNGTIALGFDCTQQYNYYNIGVYNPSVTQYSGEDLQVVNNLTF